MTKHFKSMTKEEKFEFLKKKGYPQYYPWFRQLCQHLQQEFLLWYSEPVRVKYIQDHFEFCKDKDDITIQKHKKNIELSDPKGAIEFIEMIENYKKEKMNEKY